MLSSIELEDRLGAFWAEGALAAEDCEVLREGYIEWLGHKVISCLLLT